MLNKEISLKLFVIFFFLIIGIFFLNSNTIALEKGELNNFEIKIEKLMSSSEFKVCGLNKLSNIELGKLNEWLLSHTLSVMAFGSVLSSPDVIECCIEGDFEGWKEDTIFILVNGQIWQQVSYDYEYHYAYRPEVTIVKMNDNRYMMIVEGMDEKVYVERLK